LERSKNHPQNATFQGHKKVEHYMERYLGDALLDEKWPYVFAKISKIPGILH